MTISIVFTRVLFHFVIRVKTVFGKCSEMFLWSADNSCICITDLRKVIENLRKIVKPASLLACVWFVKTEGNEMFA